MSLHRICQTKHGSLTSADIGLSVWVQTTKSLATTPSNHALCASIEILQSELCQMNACFLKPTPCNSCQYSRQLEEDVWRMQCSPRLQDCCALPRANDSGGKGSPMLMTRSVSALGLLRQNQHPSTGLPGSEAGGRPAAAASMYSGLPIISMPLSPHARSTAPSDSNWTWAHPFNLPACSNNDGVPN